jgi:DNA-binding transcriptional ArsR family regulator
MLKPASRVRPDAYETVFGALAHPARRRILLTLHFNGGVMAAGEIAAIFAHAWQTTTRHLQVLRAAGLLSRERQGRMQVYRIERKRLALVSDWLAHFQPAKQSAGGKTNVSGNQASGHQSQGIKTRSA